MTDVKVAWDSVVTVWDWTAWCGPRLAKRRVWRCALSQVENTNGTAGDTLISIEQKASDQQTGFRRISMGVEIKTDKTLLNESDILWPKYNS
ncbi:hypothetical protein PspLS_05932 [Pyricularia sp. CBS 133598]|nr:hypothetical protein PspLS_05932 [Pyricularia sp. CBS 133598]